MGTPNALFAFDAPCRLNALIDWELSTIGDPMLDLGWIGTGLRDERAPIARRPMRSTRSRTCPPGRSSPVTTPPAPGRDVSNYDYYLVLALFKAGCLLEYKVAQSAAGMLSKETGEMFSRLVADNFLEAEWIIGRVTSVG